MMPTSSPLVTIFLPYYNDQNYIARAVESILNNTYKNFELILVNHASIDDSREIVHSFNDERIRHIDVDLNYGAGGGFLLERALRVARGEYFKFFCADDLLLPDYLEKTIEFLKKNPDVSLCFTDGEYINSEDKIIDKSWLKRKKLNPRVTNDELLQKLMKAHNVLLYPSAICKTKCLRAIEVNRSFIMLYDAALWSEFIINDYPVAILSEPLVKYRIHSNQVSYPGHCEYNEYLVRLEFSSYWKIFQKIKDLRLIKKIWPDDPWMDKLDLGDIPFFVAHKFLTIEGFKNISYGYFIEVFQDVSLCKYYQNKFNYGIRELRDEVKCNFRSVDLKLAVYERQNKYLSCYQLIWLFVRKMFRLVKPRKHY